ncbi:MAG: glycosyltransferase, partial [Pseudomonadota bacterium]
VDHEVFTPKRRDLEWRRSLGISDDDLLVSFVGRIVLEKGIDVFAEAINAARAKAGNVKAIVVGDGPEADRFSKALPDSVFTGFLAGEQLARAYASADVFLNPSITESFGNVTLEAMACGSPVIGANASGSVSIIVDNQNGLLVDPRKGAAGFSEAVVGVANDRELLKTLGAEAHKTGLTYNWETILDRLINDYRDAIAGYRTADAA